jgi:WD40 repeat protein
MTIGFSLAQSSAAESQPRQGPDPASSTVAAARSTLTRGDLADDPLPARARARLGMIRFHVGHSVGRVQYTPDGKFLITADGPNVIHVWDAATGRIVRGIGDSTINLREIALSRDGKVLATAEYPARLRLWDVDTGRERKQWHEAKDEDYRYLNFEHLAFSPDGRTLAVGVSQFRQSAKTYEKSIELRDTVGPTEHRRRNRGDWHRLNDLAFSPDGKTLATTSEDTEVSAAGQKVGPEKGSVRLWDVASGEERLRFAFEERHAQSLAFSLDGRLLAAAITDGMIRMYDLVTGREREPLPGEEPVALPEVVDGQSTVLLDAPQPMYCLAFSPDGTVLASGTDDVVAYRGNLGLAAVYLWDVARGRALHQILAHQQVVVSLSFSPDGKTLASTGGEKVIRLWDVATGREAVPQRGHRSAIRALAVSPADGTVFTGGYDGTIRRWDPASGRELGIIATYADPADTWALAPDGTTLVLASPSRIKLALWSVAERREIRLLERGAAATPRRRLVWSPYGKSIAAEGRIWDAATGRVGVTFRTRDDQDASLGGWSPVSYSPDGKTVITAQRDEIRVWDVASGREVGPGIASEKIHTVAVALSPDGRLLATGGIVYRSSGGEVQDPPIRLWELASGQEVATLVGHSESTLCVAFSPDGRLLASGSGDQWSNGDHTARIWDVVTGRELRRFEAHRGMVTGIAFTPDGRSVVSGSEDATALVWDISDLTHERTTSRAITADERRARWNELAGEDSRAAYLATRALSVPSAVAFLGERLLPATSPDPHGIPAAIGPISSPEVLRNLRAIAALERVGTPEARAVLERMAQGNPGAIQTRDARSALDRPSRRPAIPVGVPQ